MKHLGDITKIDGKSIEIVDCITFGSPCQDLSVAGKRAGLDGERSGLFMEAVRIIKEMRENDTERLCMRGADVDIRLVRPRFAVWENVPGAFSSNDGEDFRVVLEELARIIEPQVCIPRLKDSKGRTDKWTPSGYIEGNGWSIAWRQMDAQYWGVPQRRKRIALLCDFGGYEAGRILLTEYFRTSADADRESSVMGVGRGCTTEVRIESEGLHGNLEPSISPWKGFTIAPERSIDAQSDESDSGESNPFANTEVRTLQLRHTGTDTRGGGVGALISEDLCPAMSCQQDRTLF